MIVKTKIMSKRLLPFFLLLPTFANASLDGEDYRVWLSRVSEPLASIDILNGADFIDLKGSGIPPMRYMELTNYNSALGAKHLADFSGEEFSLALDNLLVLARDYDYPPASYSFAMLSIARNKHYCKFAQDCSKKMTDDVKKHFTIAAEADPTGGAAFQFSTAISKERDSGWRDRMVYWGGVGKKKKILFMQEKMDEIY